MSEVGIETEAQPDEMHAETTTIDHLDAIGTFLKTVMLEEDVASSEVEL